MNRHLIQFFLALSLLCGCCGAAFAGPAVGAGWSNVEYKHQIGERWAPEVRFAFGGDVYVYSGRVYYAFLKKGQLNVFAGPEAGYINFDRSSKKGNGYEAAVFVGAEHPIFKNFGLALDIAPTYMKLSSDSGNVSDVLLIFNAAIYYHF